MDVDVSAEQGDDRARMDRPTLLDAASLPDDHPALVPDLWARAMLFFPGVTPAARATALAAAGLPQDLPPSGALKLTQQHEAILLQSLADSLDDPAFGARAAIGHDTRQGTILTYMAFAAADLRDMLDLVLRYLPITRSQTRLQVEEDAARVIVWFDFDDMSLGEHLHYGEFTVGIVLRTLRVALSGDVPVDWVSVARPDRHPAGVLDQVYGCPVRPEPGRNAVCLPVSALSLPVPTADRHLLHHLTDYGDILLERRQVHGRSTLAEVQAMILARLSFGAPSLADVAGEMAVSPRTLSRRLEREGHSYREVLETLRYDMARRYLADLSLPLTEVAFLLGFADQSGFGTAFRRWSGYAPGQYRRTL